MSDIEDFPKGSLEIPLDLAWPVVGRDPMSGGLQLQTSFVRALERLNGLNAGTLDDETLSELLTAWYLVRRQRGEERCPVMEQILAEEEAICKYGWLRVQEASPGLN